MSTNNSRGILTPEINKKAISFLKEEISTTELRLYPYLDYCWKNGGYVDRNRLNREEEKIIEHREKQGLLVRRYGGVNCPSRAFYNFVQDVLAYSYVTFCDKPAQMPRN